MSSLALITAMGRHCESSFRVTRTDGLAADRKSASTFAAEPYVLKLKFKGLGFFTLGLDGLTDCTECFGKILRLMGQRPGLDDPIGCRC